jgi:hypothetical protein
LVSQRASPVGARVLGLSATCASLDRIIPDDCKRVAATN